MRRPWWFVAGLAGLVGCSPEVDMAWDLVEGDELGQTVVLALFGILYQQDEEARVEGPHVASSTIEVAVRHPNPNQSLEGWRLVSDDDGIAQLGVQEISGNTLRVQVALGQAGDTVLTLRNPADDVVDTQAIQVREPADADVEPYVDLRAGDGPPVGSDGSLALLEGGAASLVVAWLDGTGEVMTGKGALSVLPGDTAAAARSLDVSAQASFVLANADYFTLEAKDPTDSPLPLEMYAGARLVKTWQVEVLPATAIDAVDLATDLDSGPASDDGNERIGWLRGDAFAGDRRVLGADLAWQEDGVVVGEAAFAELVRSSTQHTIRACVVGTAICDEIVEFGRLGVLGDGVVGGLEVCGCAHGPRPSWALVGAGLLAWGLRRRRGSV